MKRERFIHSFCSESRIFVPITHRTEAMNWLGFFRRFRKTKELATAEACGVPVMKVLFLDIDGVLHTTSHDASLIRYGLLPYDEQGPIFSPKCVEQLTRIIRETSAGIVISSSWKDSAANPDTLSLIRRIWEIRHMPGEILDVTPTLTHQAFKAQYPRISETKWKGCEIDSWLKQNFQAGSYAIVDDLPIALPHQKPHFVRTSPSKGLTPRKANRIIKLLNN